MRSVNNKTHSTYGGNMESIHARKHYKATQGIVILCLIMSAMMMLFGAVLS